MLDAGKSVLTSFLIDEMKSNSSPTAKNSTPLNVCYFFFKDDSEEQRNASHALSAILHQIFCSQPVLSRHALLEQSIKRPMQRRPLHSLWKIFKSVMEDKYLPNTICFIDALDECEPKSRAEFGNI